MEAAYFEQIELYLSCRNLKNMDHFSKSDPQIRLYVKDNNEWNLFAQTEVIQDNLNPVFDTTFILNHSTKIQRHLLFEVIDIDGENEFELIGKAETTINEILNTKKKLLYVDLSNKGGEIVIRAESIKQKCNIVSFECSCTHLDNKDGLFGKSDPFLKFYKIRQGGDQLLVFETEVIMDNLNPAWNPFKIKDYKLCDNYKEMFKIECWDWEKSGHHQYIGGCEISLSQLKTQAQSFELHSFKHKRTRGKINLGILLEERPAFTNYIKSENQLNLIVGLDFSKANGDPKKATSLHYRADDSSLSEYQKALNSVCEVLLHEDPMKSVTIYGFGGVPKFQNFILDSTSHCFPCNGDLEKPEVIGLSGVNNCYINALQNVEQTGQACFAPLIKEVTKICEDHENRKTNIYTILVIFTSGEINDIEVTINTLLRAASLPLSIVIIGVGKGDFTKMEILDGDKGLANKKGEKAMRDIVQFVSFRGFGGDMDYLAQRVLAEIPDQVVEYMNLDD